MTTCDVQQQVQEAIDRLVESGSERGLQVAVYSCGEPLVDAGYSIGKGVAATVVHVLAERGLIDYDTPIAEL